MKNAERYGRKMKYSLHDDITSEEAGFVQRKLVEFSDRFTEPREPREIGVVLRDEHGTVGGGITANTAWDWFFIDVLWVSDELRGQGYGHALHERAEEMARAGGCRFAALSTFEFQAREFHEAHGYEVQGQIDDFPKGHTQYRMSKAL